MTFMELKNATTPADIYAIESALLDYRGFPIYVEYGDCINLQDDVEENMKSGFGVGSGEGANSDYAYITFFPEGKPKNCRIYKKFIKKIIFSGVEVYNNEHLAKNSTK